MKAPCAVASTAPGERGHVVGKTGTYGDYGACALAGAVRTRDRGVVYFAILNHNVPIDVARKRQDAFVRALLASQHTDAWSLSARRSAGVHARGDRAGSAVASRQAQRPITRRLRVVAPGLR